MLIICEPGKIGQCRVDRVDILVVNANNLLNKNKMIFKRLHFKEKIKCKITILPHRMPYVSFFLHNHASFLHPISRTCHSAISKVATLPILGRNSTVCVFYLVVLWAGQPLDGAACHHVARAGWSEVSGQQGGEDVVQLISPGDTGGSWLLLKTKDDFMTTNSTRYH